MTHALPLLLNLAVLGGLLFYVVRSLRRGRHSRSWPTVQATVTAARAVRSGQNFVPRIDYAYVVDGRSYTSRRRKVGPPISISRGAAEAVVAACPVGSTVVASVDPANPAYAVLVPGMAGAHLLMLAVGVAMLVATVVATFLFGGGGPG